jgi:hypothetical protein
MLLSSKELVKKTECRNDVFQGMHFILHGLTGSPQTLQENADILMLKLSAEIASTCHSNTISSSRVVPLSWNIPAALGA